MQNIGRDFKNTLHLSEFLKYITFLGFNTICAFGLNFENPVYISLSFYEL